MDLRRITLFADDPGDERSADFLWVEAWLERWKGQVRVVDYSTGGWEHLWDVEAPPEAAAEIPDHLLCASAWSDPESAWSPKRCAVETAKMVLSGEIGIIEGSVQLSQLAHAVVPNWAEDADFVVFGALSSESDHLPTGSARQYWSAAALAEADIRIARIENDAREDVMRACGNVIKRFSDAEQAAAGDARNARL
jgi:hypothetical protein